MSHSCDWLVLGLLCGIEAGSVLAGGIDGPGPEVFIWSQVASEVLSKAGA